LSIGWKGGRGKALGIRLVPFDREAARHYAQIRKNRAIRAPDAIQLACAAAANVDMFVTNDARLSRVNVPGIDFIVPLDRVFL
jgi:predicted nucleic acid-binding protein